MTNRSTKTQTLAAEYLNRIRKLGLAPVKWLTPQAVWKERLEEALKSNAGREQIDQRFIDRLQERRSNIEKLYWKLSLTQMVLIAALFLNAVVLSPDISIAGLTAKHIGAMKELVLFVTATIWFFVSVLDVERHILKSVASAWVEKTYVPETLELSRLLYGDLVLEFPKLGPPEKVLPRTGFLDGVYVVLGVLLVVLFFSLITANVAMYIVVIADIVKAPSLPVLWSWCIVGYTILVFLINVIVSTISRLPLPYRDYSVAFELVGLHGDAFKARVEELLAKR